MTQDSCLPGYDSIYSGQVKVKCTLVQALRLCTGRTAYRGSRGIALPFHDHGTRRGWWVSVTPRPLFTLGKDPAPIVQEAGWATGPAWTGAENLAPSTGIRSPDRPARSQSLYWLRYPAHTAQPIFRRNLMPSCYISNTEAHPTYWILDEAAWRLSICLGNGVNQTQNRMQWSPSLVERVPFTTSKLMTHSFKAHIPLLKRPLPPHPPKKKSCVMRANMFLQLQSSRCVTLNYLKYIIFVKHNYLFVVNYAYTDKFRL